MQVLSMQVRETREPPKNFRPRSIRRRKVYELAVQRNEWTDWHGSTDLVHRATNFADTKEVGTREFMQARAEAKRKQGSHFHVRVIPVLLLENREHCLMVGEKYTDKPLCGLSEHVGLQGFVKMTWSKIFAELMSFCLAQRGGVILVPTDRKNVADLEPFTSGSPCFHFESFPSRNAASLGWGSCGRVSTYEFDTFMSAVRRKKATEEQRRPANP